MGEAGCGGFGAYVPGFIWGALEQYWVLGFKGSGVRRVAEMRRVAWSRSARVNREKPCMLTLGFRCGREIERANNKAMVAKIRDDEISEKHGFRIIVLHIESWRSA